LISVAHAASKNIKAPDWGIKEWEADQPTTRQALTSSHPKKEGQMASCGIANSANLAQV
jgi:hypothetical protein